jgi:superfamily II DNA or RNA helicase
VNLRPYQQETVRAVVKGWSDPGDGDPSRQLVVVPTGGGKTVIFAKLAEVKQGVGQRTLILAHREELIGQAVDKIRAATGIEAFVEKAERHAPRHASVVVASVQTLTRSARLETWAENHFGLVVCDEAHHAISPSWRTVLSRFDPVADVVGVTATPDRGDKRNLAEYFTSLAYEVRLVDLIKDGYLCPITIRAVPLEIDIRAVRSVAGDLDAQQIGDALEPYLTQIARALKQYAAGRRILAFLPLIATSRKFVEACQVEGLRAEHVDGRDEDRAAKLGAFELCEHDVLSNAMLLTEGYDDPGIDCVVVLRPTKSRSLYAQMIGRGTRTHPLKSNLLILDFLWMHERHSIARPASLVARDDEEADMMQAIANEREEAGQGGGEDGQDILDLQGDAVAQREESLKKKLKEQAGKRGKYISADEWAAEHDRTSLADFQPVFAWEEKPITEGQARVLKRAHIDPETVRGRGHASQIIDAVLGDVAKQRCSVGQVALLRRMGHPSPDTATVGEFRKMMGQMKGAKQ